MRWLWLIVLILTSAALVAWFGESSSAPADPGKPSQIDRADRLTNSTDLSGLTVPAIAAAPSADSGPAVALPAGRLQRLFTIGLDHGASVEVVRPEERIDVGNGRSRITAEPAPEQNASECVGLLAYELDLYPIEFLRAVRLSWVVLCNELSCNGEPAGGLANPAAQRIYLNVNSLLGDTAYARQTMHHELFHLMDRNDSWIRTADAEWEVLNLAGFRYDEGQAGTARPRAPGTGFLSLYARSAVAEDKSEVFGFMMSDPKYVAKRVADDRVVAAKVARMKVVAAKFCPELDGQFWDRVTATRSAKVEAKPEQKATESNVKPDRAGKK